jgi:VIT1/CCC1 family predicted Fe2+/Mn2+ transporter
MCVSVSRKYVEKIEDAFDESRIHLLTIEEYQRDLEDPSGYPEVMSLGELVRNPSSRKTERKVIMSNAQLNVLLAFGFGVVFIFILLAMVVFIPNPTPRQFQIMCVVLALAAGGFSGAFTGAVRTTVSVGQRIVVGAVGAFAVFVIVYFFLPAMVS